MRRACGFARRHDLGYEVRARYIFVIFFFFFGFVGVVAMT
jgi:hypothetical protein